MSVKSFDVMNLGRAGLIAPEQMGYKDSLEIIKDESFKIQKSFVKIGWYLKHIRDNELYKEDGYENIYECAADQLGYSQSTASRFINICEKFSKDHNSPEIDAKYAGFDKSQMIEMLPMEPEQLEKVTPDMTVKQIREMKSANKVKSDTSIPADDNVPGQTSIEADFPEYMPESPPVRQEDYESHAISNENNHISDEKYQEISAAQKTCITGWNEYGVCSCCGYNGAKCCIECKEDCNGRCGWIGNNLSKLKKLKNDDQRKEWLNNYKAWGLWYHDEHIDANYYKFDFLDGSRLVVAEYPQRTCYWDGKLSDEHHYHLLEKNKKVYGEVVYDEKYRNSTDSETYLVDFLKNLQKRYY